MLFEQYQQLLREYLRFKSISTNPNFQSELAAVVEWLRRLLESHGFQVQVFKTEENPVILASFEVEKNLKTVLVYGHYDVQFADKSEGWETDPFELTQRENRLFGRGVVDNKGQFLVHLVNLFNLIETNQLGYNIKLLIEGNEETGSAQLEEFIKAHQQELKADFILISDGEISGGKPNLEVGFRGGFNLSLTVRTGKTDLHSGIFGSAAPNAVHELIKILAQLFDWQENKIALPGFYDSVKSVTEEERRNNQQIPFSREEYERITGCQALLLEPGNDFYTQTGLRPAIEVTGLVGGYVGEGYRNAIPAQAQAKLNFRLTAEQHPEEIFQLFQQWLKKIAPSYLEFKTELDGPYLGVRLNRDNPYLEKAKQILARVWQSEVVFKYVGGGLPIVTYFDQILRVPQLLVPLANEDCAMHSVNENFELSYWQRAMAFSQELFKK